MRRHLLSSLTRVVRPGRKSESARLTLSSVAERNMQELVPLGGDYQVHGTPHSTILYVVLVDTKTEN